MVLFADTDLMFVTSDDDVVSQMAVVIGYDLVSAAVAAIQATKHDDSRTVCELWWRLLETHGHSLACRPRAVYSQVAAAPEHSFLPRHGPSHSHRAKARWERVVGSIVERSVPTSCSSKQTLARRSLGINPVHSSKAERGAGSNLAGSLGVAGSEPINTCCRGHGG